MTALLETISTCPRRRLAFVPRRSPPLGQAIAIKRTESMDTITFRLTLKLIRTLLTVKSIHMPTGYYKLDSTTNWTALV